MTPCVGWHGPCSVHGPMHGCQLADGHTGRHICACGLDRNGRQIHVISANRPGRKPSARCGTRSGYMRHLMLDEPTCDECRRAHAAYYQQRRMA